VVNEIEIEYERQAFATKKVVASQSQAVGFR
jgi:hypothetical protein